MMILFRLVFMSIQQLAQLNTEDVNQKVDSSSPIEVSWMYNYCGVLVKSGDSHNNILDVISINT